MKYTILINQVGIVRAGLHDKTDLVDWAIIDYLQHWYFAENKKTIFVQERGTNYVWVNYQHLLDNMPLLNINDKDALSHRMKKLRELGLIDCIRMPDNSLYFMLTPKCISVIGFTENTNGIKPRRSRRPRQLATETTNAEAPNEDLSDENKTGCPMTIGQGLSYDDRTAQIYRSIKSTNTNLKRSSADTNVSAGEVFTETEPDNSGLRQPEGTEKAATVPILVDKETPQVEEKTKEKQKKRRATRTYGEVERELVEMLRDWREQMGCPPTQGDWHLRELAVAAKLLKTYTAEELKACFTACQKDDYWGKLLDSWITIERYLPRWRLKQKFEGGNDKRKINTVDYELEAQLNEYRRRMGLKTT